MFAICSADSSDIARFCLAEMPNPWSSRRVRSLADAEVDASVRDQVECRQPLRGPRRVVVVGDHLADAVAEPDVRRSCRRSSEEHLGRRRVRILVQEVVLDLPRVVEAEPVGQLDLVEGLVEEPVLVVLAPRLGELVLVEDPELHDPSRPHRTLPVAAGPAATITARVVGSPRPPHVPDCAVPG